MWGRPLHRLRLLRQRTGPPGSGRPGRPRREQELVTLGFLPAALRKLTAADGRGALVASVFLASGKNLSRA